MDHYNEADELDLLTKNAYKLWDLLEYEEAAKIFWELAQRERINAISRNKWARPDSSILYECRCGICLFSAGNRDDSLKILERVVNFDWKNSRLWTDRHDSEKALFCLAMYSAEKNDKVMFDKWFNLGVQNGELFKLKFPSSVDSRRGILTSCIKFNDKDKIKWICDLDHGKIFMRNSEYNTLREFAIKILNS